ncbi:MAG: hypothetical protein Q7S16_05565 [bacterium]|nr:hypothetical protein [bacterium]
MLTFAGIVPHTLELLKNPKKAKATIDALEAIQKSFVAQKPDVVIVISPHGTTLEKSFAVNLAQEYEIDLLELGVKIPKRTFKNDPLTTIAIRKARLTDTEAPVTLVSSPKLDYGTAVPLSFLCPKGEYTVIPTSPSHHALETNYAFGDTIKEEVMGSTKRFAVIASATFGQGSGAQQFNEGILAHLVSDEKAKELFTTSEADLKKFDMCGLRPLLILMGVLNGLPWSYKQISFETAFDTGLLVAEFPLKT